MQKYYKYLILSVVAFTLLALLTSCGDSGESNTLKSISKTPAETILTSSSLSISPSPTAITQVNSQNENVSRQNSEEKSKPIENKQINTAEEKQTKDNEIVKSVRTIVYEEGKYFKDNLIGDEAFEDANNPEKFNKHIESLEKFWHQIPYSSNTTLMNDNNMPPIYGCASNLIGMLGRTDANFQLASWITKDYANYTLTLECRKRVICMSGDYVRFCIDGNDFAIPNDNSDITPDNVWTAPPDIYDSLKLVKLGQTVTTFFNGKKVNETTNFKSLKGYEGVGFLGSYPYVYRNFELIID